MMVFIGALAAATLAEVYKIKPLRNVWSVGLLLIVIWYMRG